LAHANFEKDFMSRTPKNKIEIPETAMNITHELLNNDERYFLTDGGLETWLIFQKGMNLREFSSFELIYSDAGKLALNQYFNEFLDLADSQKAGFILDTPTWRANPDWCCKLGYDHEEIERINVDAAQFVLNLRDKRRPSRPVVINGVIGPRGDGYVVGDQMDAQQAENYHRDQAGALEKGKVDMITAVTMTNSQESIGIARASMQLHIPCVISFTVEVDGRLPSGQLLADAIAEVDCATDCYPLYYMINCAHPDHFRDVVDSDQAWVDRIGGVRANASRMSHAELDAAEVLDQGDPMEFGALHADLIKILPNIRVLGGCCGTDHRHIHCIAQNL
jgi:homocysteine S-methyltransferase